ncbi:MAG: hypothetical protein K2X01_10970 [Cyanobacteria bacterium]|nr:hypothetical protein [Cyanobacteriota bacterium]
MSVGLVLSRAPQELSDLLKSPASKKILDKVGAQFGLPQGTTTAVSAVLDKVAEKVGKENIQGNSVIPFRRSPQELSIKQATEYLKQFDKNGDGQVSETELKESAAALKQEITQAFKSGKVDPSKLHQLSQAYGFASQLSKQYSQISKLDGEATGISQKDLSILAGLDGNGESISRADIKQLYA